MTAPATPTPLDVIASELFGEFATDSQASAIIAVRALVEAALEWSDKHHDSDWVYDVLETAAARYRAWTPQAAGTGTGGVHHGV